MYHCVSGMNKRTNKICGKSNIFDSFHRFCICLSGCMTAQVAYEVNYQNNLGGSNGFAVAVPVGGKY